MKNHMEYLNLSLSNVVSIAITRGFPALRPQKVICRPIAISVLFCLRHSHKPKKRHYYIVMKCNF